MSLTKLVESFKKQMTSEQYEKFTYFVSVGVDLYAKNTANRKCKDLAEYQIKQLAWKCASRLKLTF